MYHSYIANYLDETAKIANQLSGEQAEVTNGLIQIINEAKKKNGRVFFIGVGGGSGTGSHATNDFNKIGGISSFNLTDNPSLFTALANDEGWDSVFIRQMQMHHFNETDVLFVFSVGGGNEETSPNIVKAVDYALSVNAKIVGVVGRENGHTAQNGHAVIVLPIMHEDRVTAHTENWQLVINHLIVNALVAVPESEETTETENA